MIPKESDLSGNRWGELTYPELQERANSNGSVLVVPVGAIEQHGRHLPTATDTILATTITKRSVDATGEQIPVVTTPAVWFGFSPHHLSFGATVSFPYELLVESLYSIGKAGVENGFDAVLYLNGHGGNKPATGMTTSKLGAEYPEAQVLDLFYLDLFEPGYLDLKLSDTTGTHASEIETSLMLAVRPDLVHMERAATIEQEEPYDRVGTDLLASGPLSIYRSFDEYTETGNVGDPTQASAEKGQQLLKYFEEQISEILLQVHQQEQR